MVVISLFAWLPLLVLSLIEGHALGDAVKVPFLYDVDAHARFLLALPLLILAELVVHQRMRPLVQQFLERGLVPDNARARFGAAIASAMRWRNSVGVEVLLVVFVYLVGVLVIWRTQARLEVGTWYGVVQGGKAQVSLAGWWLGLVSLPLFQFLLLRWYYRLFLWARFLWQVSRIKLNLVATHPDRTGGLGFLALVTESFAPLMLAQGTFCAGVLASSIFFAGTKLPQFQVELIGLLVVVWLVVLGPLLVFLPQLARAKRTAQYEYGTLAQSYTRQFDAKWLRSGAVPKEPLLGSADLQSLADLGNSFEVIQEMKLVPFTKAAVLQIAVSTLLPVAPLVLTMFSPDEIISRVLKVVF